MFQQAHSSGGVSRAILNNRFHSSRKGFQAFHFESAGAIGVRAEAAGVIESAFEAGAVAAFPGEQNPSGNLGYIFLEGELGLRHVSVSRIRAGD